MGGYLAPAAAAAGKVVAAVRQSVVVKASSLIFPLLSRSGVKPARQTVPPERRRARPGKGFRIGGKLIYRAAHCPDAQHRNPSPASAKPQNSRLSHGYHDLAERTFADVLECAGH